MPGEASVQVHLGYGFSRRKLSWKCLCREQLSNLVRVAESIEEIAV